MKIFCIGLYKTGTTSLAAALREQGYSVRHGYKKHSDMMLNDLKDGRPPLESFQNAYGEHEAYADLRVLRDHFVWFDKCYPDSKFILTTRDENEWVESVKRQIAKRPESPYFHPFYYQSELQWRYHKRMHVMDNLIEALQILTKYDNPEYPAECEIRIMVDYNKVSNEDIGRLHELGFIETDNWDLPHFLSRGEIRATCTMITSK